ncbi:PREDICTED: disease resistance protein TAO1-like isoform X2 [Tarenaya hassleriana]|uniref:disease resistance protein TAO1-like isoform X2 n=1 Tax=Tarenaya hassleriana TaxID=28532 RepID=UPI00053C5B25|nr:PREDICTED: disease resistance protein TAO1-like isoform X2 [Tarenaya hassleriana]
MFTADSSCFLTLPPCRKLLRLRPSQPPKKLFSRRTSSPSPISTRSIARFHRSPSLTTFPPSKRSIRASSSSPLFSPSSKPTKYDVFISFRGEDTRVSFTSHLAAALRRDKIETFLDNDKLRKGEEISPALVEAIEVSRIAVVVFSRDYASSRWCLDELVKILECRKKNGQIVLPVFFDIDPTDVRRQTGSYSAAFAAHEEYYRRRSPAAAARVKRWRAALTEAANLSGFDSTVIRPESELVKEVVTCILKHLNGLKRGGKDDLIGVETLIEEVLNLLGNGKDDIRCVGIWGMAGIGKTTIAGAIFNHICSRFEGCCFLANVREESERRGIFSLRSELLCQIFDQQDIIVSTPEIGQRFLRDKLCRTRVLIVLDDVSSLRQLEFLIKDVNYFRPGSRIIITTRDKDVLKHGVDVIYEVKGLADSYALELFFRCALKETVPSNDHLHMGKRVLLYANRNPLALKVLGSFLCQKSIKEWESALYRLQKLPDIEIQRILQISYEDLNEEEKEIFLDISCFFKGEDKSFVTNMLDGCGFAADIGIRALIDKSLVTVSQNKLQMHDLIQDMGKEIVRREAPREPGRRSRLWSQDDIFEVLTKDKGTEAIECIFLNLSQAKKMQLSPQAFSTMCNLRFLKIYDTESSQGNCKLDLPEGLEFLSDKLTYLHWHSYSLKSLPPKFCPENLVELSMKYSSLEQLWDCTKDVRNLRRIDLSYSTDLKGIPDLSGSAALECISLRACRNLDELSSVSCKLKQLKFLDLSGCSNLAEFPEISWDLKELLLEATAVEELPLTIRNFTQLVKLDLGNCNKLKKVPSIDYELESLEYLNMSGCSSITTFPEISRSLKTLILNGTAINEIPASIIVLGKLVFLDLQNCRSLASLPSCICHLKSLRELNLSGCSDFDSFPEILERMDALSCLSLNGTAIKELPSSIDQLHVLSSLDLGNCKSLVSLPDGFCSLESLKDLNLSGCTKLENLPKCSSNLNSMRMLRANRCNGHVIALLLESLLSLRILHLSDCGLSEFPETLTQLSSLMELDLSRNNFERIPPSIKEFNDLRSLDLTNCERLQSLPQLPGGIRKLDASNCTALETISGNKRFNIQIYPLNYVETFVFANCHKLGQDAQNIIAQQAELRLHAWMSLSSFMLNLITKTSPFTWMRSEQIRYLFNRMHEYKDYSEALQGLYHGLLNEEPEPGKSPYTMMLRILSAIHRRSRLDVQGHFRFFTWATLLSLSYQDKPSTSFCFPGNGVPEWFEFQCVGFQISMNFQTDKQSNVPSLFVGFAICAVVDFQSYHGDNGFSVKCQCHFHTKKFDSFDIVCYLRGCSGHKGEFMLVEGDHLFVGYDFSLIFDAANGSKRLFSFSQILHEVSFEFSVVDSDDNPLDCCRVTKCGILPLYFNDTIPSGNQISKGHDKGKEWIQVSSRIVAEAFKGYGIFRMLFYSILRIGKLSMDFVHKGGKIYLFLAYSFAGHEIFSILLEEPEISGHPRNVISFEVEPKVPRRDNGRLLKHGQSLKPNDSEKPSTNKTSRAADRNGEAINLSMLLISVIGIVGLSWCFIVGPCN